MFVKSLTYVCGRTVNVVYKVSDRECWLERRRHNINDRSVIVWHSTFECEQNKNRNRKRNSFYEITLVCTNSTATVLILTFGEGIQALRGRRTQGKTIKFRRQDYTITFPPVVTQFGNVSFHFFPSTFKILAFLLIKLKSIPKIIITNTSQKMLNQYLHNRWYLTLFTVLVRVVFVIKRAW